MKHRRSVRKQLEQRLRDRQPEVENLWESFRREAESIGANLELVERLERRMTWGLWAVALHEATELMDDLAGEEPEPQLAPPWLCQTCKRRVLRVVGADDDLPATA
ncbi:MAG: hypothetical protein WD557_07495 [Dehalococcoidia bacterium]